MQSACTGSDQSTEFDIIVSNKDFIKKMGHRWKAIADTYDFQSSSYFSSNFNKVNDTLDVCNYRVIENYTVNKVPNLNESNDFDMSDSDGNGYFNMEDTLDICSYRRNNLASGSNDQGESTLVDPNVIAEYSSNKSTTDDQHMDGLNKSITKMEDTLDVCYYRRKSAVHSLTPIRYNPRMSSNFNQYLVPFAHFSPSPIALTDSPTVNNSSFVVQFSDQSDDTFNLSSE